MKKLLLALLVCAFGYGQNKVNEYKYIIVPKKFEFLKEENQYRLNTLTKFLFQENGFTTVYNDELPDELRRNPCMGLKTNVLNNSGLFTTKLQVELKDCGDQVVYTSGEGKSKIKDFQNAYSEALKGAFESIEKLNYKYDPSEEIIEVVEMETTAPSAVEKTVTQPAVETKVITAQTKVAVPAVEVEVASDLLYAQPKENGYQLIDMTPKVVMMLKKTSQENMFIAQKGQLSGTVYAENGSWYFEYYEGNTLKKEKLNIKF